MKFDLLTLIFFFVVYIESMAQNVNDRPIIGILSLEPYSVKKVAPPDTKSYISAAYVKFIECAGARVVPILIGKDRKYYENIMKQINGVFFTGGATYFDEPNGFVDAGYHIYDIAKKLNDDGEHFTLWGVCLGFQLLLYLSSNRTVERVDCNNLGEILKLNLKEDFQESKLFANAPEEIVAIIQEQEVFTFYHKYCYTQKLLDDNSSKFGIEWTVISTNKDRQDKEFISLIESKKYPFYGMQFHPEKNIFQWSEKYNINHSKEAILANRYFADFFVEQCRNNLNTFIGVNEIKSYLLSFSTNFYF